MACPIIPPSSVLQPTTCFYFPTTLLLRRRPSYASIAAQFSMDVDVVRSTQRAPRRCTECAQRKVKCSLTIPCDACYRRGIAHSCRREVVSVRGKIVSYVAASSTLLCVVGRWSLVVALLTAAAITGHLLTIFPPTPSRHYNNKSSLSRTK